MHYNSINDDNDNEISSGDDLKIVAKPIGTRYDVYMSDSVESPQKYYDLFQVLDQVTANDLVRLHLNNFGGLVHTGVQLVHAVQQSGAEVRAHIAAPLYSMASVLALACHSFEVEEHVFLMFHDYSTGEVGKGNEIQLSVQNYRPYFEKLMLKVCYPFLTKREIRAILNGTDLYVPFTTAEDMDGNVITGISERLEKMAKGKSK